MPVTDKRGRGRTGQREPQNRAVDVTQSQQSQWGGRGALEQRLPMSIL